VFALFLGLVYCLYAWILQSASKVPNPHLHRHTLMERMADLPLSADNFIDGVLADWYWVLAHSPGGVMLSLLPVLGCLAFTAAAAERRPTLAALGGALHGIGHVAVALLLLWSVSHLNFGPLREAFDVPLNQWIDDPRQVFLFTVEVLVGGGFIGAILFGFWLIVGNLCAGWHEQEVFSSQSLQDYKSFLRMRLDAHGLTIYPIGLDAVPRRWKLAPGHRLVRKVRHGWWWRCTTWVFHKGAAAGPVFRPEKPMAPAPIEPPVVIAPAQPPSSTPAH
jgi:hypothetical protein